MGGPSAGAVINVVCVGMPSAHELPFAANIPRGHAVLVVTFTLGGKSPTMVLDRTASSLYCGEDLWGPLHQDPIHALTDPVTVVTRWSWTVRSAFEGVSAGALVQTKGWGERHEVKTLLLVEPSGVPYR